MKNIMKQGLVRQVLSQHNGSYTGGFYWLEANGLYIPICGDFIEKVFGIKTHSICVDIRLKNPKEKGFKNINIYVPSLSMEGSFWAQKMGAPGSYKTPLVWCQKEFLRQMGFVLPCSVWMRVTIVYVPAPAIQ